MSPKFRELSSVNQFRVFRYLTRGDAPNDPELAAATLDAAEHYQIQNRVVAALLQWWPVILALPLIAISVPGALDGQVAMIVFILCILLGVVGNVILNPWTRPKNVARAEKASRRVVAETVNQSAFRG